MAVVIKNKLGILSRVGFGKSFAALTAVFCSFILVSASPAFAVDVDDVAVNIIESTAKLPALIAALAYLLGLILAISGILKFKEHVENPTQAPLRTPVIRFIIAGALFALPIIYEAMLTAINGGDITEYDPSNGVVGAFLTILAGLANIPGLNMITMDLNGVLSRILDSLENVPSFIAVLAFLLGLVLGVSGLLKLKDHVENPEQNPLREGVIRLLIGGALFALPTVYRAMEDAIGGAGVLGSISSIFGALSFVRSGYGGSICNPLSSFGSNASVGDALCGIITHAGAVPAFLTAIAYLIGLSFGVWGIYKIKAHVLKPEQVSISEGVTRLLAGGAFFALPIIIEVARNTIAPIALTAPAFQPITQFNETLGACQGPKGSQGLDCAMAFMLNDILGPTHALLNFFAFCAGTIFIMIGTSRLIKSSQEGARGPGGFGTIMTFFCGGALISYNELIRAATQTMSLGTYGLLPVTRTFAKLKYEGADSDDLTHVHTVISAILKFMIIVGLISFVRGIFIIRNVAEGGNNQASLMAGVTHVVGGALAVNLGPLMMAVQSTLGITGYGIAFS